MNKDGCGGKAGKVVGEVIGYGIAVVVMYLVFPRLAFVTETYSLWLPIGLWTTGLSTVFKILKHLVGVRALKKMFEVMNLGASLYSTYWLREIFPVDFSVVGYGNLNGLMQFALGFAMLAVVIGMVANAVQIVVPKKRVGKKQ